MATFKCGNTVSVELLTKRLIREKYTEISQPKFELVAQKGERKKRGVYIVTAKSPKEKEAARED